MKNKKLIFSLGSIVTVAPIIAVVSCGTTKTASQEQLELYRDATSTEALKILEMKWQEKVIGADKTDTNIKVAAQYYIRSQLKNDSRYLIKLGQQLLFNGTVTEGDLKANGFLKEYKNGKITFNANGLTETGYNKIINDSKLSFKNDVYKQMIIQKYLKEGNRENYKTAFPDKYLSSMENEYDDNNFVLIKQMMDKKLFAKWELSLTAKQNSSWYIGKKWDMATLLPLISGTGELAAKANADEKESKFIADFINLGDAKYGNIVNFKGFSSMSATGNNKLSFREEKLKEMTALSNWEGFIQKDDIVTTEISGFPEKSNDFKLTFVKGIMPIYKDSKFQLPDEFKTSGVTNQDLIQLMAFNDSSLYATAMNYFIAIDKDKYMLTLRDSVYKDILVNNFGVKYVRTAE